MGRDISVGIRLATYWTVRGSNVNRGDIFHTRPHWPWNPPIRLNSGYLGPFQGVKRPGRGVDHSPPSSAEVKESLKLYLFFASEPTRPLPGRTLPLPSVLTLQGVTQMVSRLIVDREVQV